MRHLARLPHRLCLLAALALGACGGDSATSPGPDGEGDPVRTVKADPSFNADIQEIFGRRGCATSGCHGSSQAAGLDLRPGNSYTELVNVQASNEPISRVVPNDAQNSYLVIKIEGRHTVGSRMPIGGAPLDNIDVTNIRNWVDRGALNN